MPYLLSQKKKRKKSTAATGTPSTPNGKQAVRISKIVVLINFKGNSG